MVIYDNLEQYLHDKRVKKEDKNKKRTHTRIPSSNPEEDGFWGGSYNIPQNDPIFWKLYWEFVNKKSAFKKICLVICLDFMRRTEKLSCSLFLGNRLKRPIYGTSSPVPIRMVVLSQFKCSHTELKADA